MTAPALAAIGLTCGYDTGRPVLSGLDLEVPPGCVLALLGANGSGKSTLLKIFAGTLQPWAGRVELFGIGLAEFGRRALARWMAVVPQSEIVATHFTVREVVALGRHPWQSRFAAESTEDRALVAQALAAVDLVHLADRPARALSGGERQRVQIAVALAQRPQVFLLDEPTTYLDIRHQIEVLDLVTGHARVNGRTVVMVLHDLNLAAAYADRLVLLHEGRILAEGPPVAVLTTANIAAAYGLEVEVIHGAWGRPHVVPRSRTRRASAGGPRVHLVGGGGTAANLLADLAERGYRLSLGVVNRGDLDATVAVERDVAPILIPPASPVSADAASRCLAAMLSADAVVVANAPFGPGNLENLRLTLQARQAGKPVLVINEDPIEARDFTGGEAAALMHRLLVAGAVEIGREQMAADRLAECLPTA